MHYDQAKDWMFVSPHIQILKPVWWYLGMGPVGGDQVWRKPSQQGPHDGIKVLMRTERDQSSLSLCHMGV